MDARQGRRITLAVFLALMLSFLPAVEADRAVIAPIQFDTEAWLPEVCWTEDLDNNIIIIPPGCTYYMNTEDAVGE